MNLRIIRKTIPLLLPFLIVINLVTAQTSIGVSPGDTFTYNFYAFWSSTDPTASIPADVLALNETRLIKITVHQAAGAMVIMNITKQFINDTEVSTQVFVNLLSGDGDGFGLIIAPNLTKNSLVYPMGLNTSNSFVIDEELVRTYSFGEREVLHTSINKTGLTDYRYIYYDMYFDKTTGVMLEWYVEQVSRSAPNEKTAVLWKIKDFNVKAKEEPSNQTTEVQPAWQTPLTLGALSIVALLIGFYAYKKRKKSMRRRRNLNS
ncbi:MAG: hypothetical protein QXM52_05445 [Candidatus Bathyarchaeia archaeon]